MVIELKDSGSRTEFATGAVRDCQQDKGRMDLLPLHALMEISKIYEAGCRKYGDRNWEKGIPLSRFLDSGMRHLVKWTYGYTDEPHLHQMAWNFLCMDATVLDIESGRLPYSLNDLPRAVVKNPDLTALATFFTEAADAKPRPPADDDIF